MNLKSAISVVLTQPTAYQCTLEAIRCEIPCYENSFHVSLNLGLLIVATHGLTPELRALQAQNHTDSYEQGD
jgi:hypothetical protein